MDISKLLEKENAQYLGSIIKRISNGIFIMIFITAVFIAVIADMILLKTFPAWTLITLAICLLILGIKLYVNRQENLAIKNQLKIFFQQEYDFAEPMLNHLTEEETELIRPLSVKNALEISFDDNIIFQQILAKGFYRYLTTIDYAGIPQRH